MGASHSFCYSITQYEKNSVSVPITLPIRSSTVYEKKFFSKESFRMSSFDLKLSHKDFRHFVLSKLKYKVRESPEMKVYYEFYESVTKDRVAFESINWLFSIKWIEYIQSSNSFSPTCGKLFETAASINSLQSIEKEGGKLTYIHFLKFIVEEIIKNNYKIAQIMEKFRSIFFSLNQNILQNDLFLQMCDENSLKIIKNKMIKELEDFLFDPLKDFIVFFYSSTLERMVFHYLGQNFQSLNLFIVDVMHNLVFKSQNRIYRLISSVLTLSNNKELFNLKNKMMKKVDKLSLPSLIENQGFIYSNDILSKIEDKTYFERAFSKVHLISEVRTPLMKLELIAQIRTEIINALDQINEDFNLEIDIRKKQNRLDTDQMISLFCYVILKSKHESIIREIKFIEQFIGNKLIEETQWGYLFEIVRSAVDYLLSVESV